MNRVSIETSMNIPDFSQQLSILNLFLIKQEIFFKHDATVIVNHSIIKNCWIDIKLATKKITCNLLE